MYINNNILYYIGTPVGITRIVGRLNYNIRKKVRSTCPSPPDTDYIIILYTIDTIVINYFCNNNTIYIYTPNL